MKQYQDYNKRKKQLSRIFLIFPLFLAVALPAYFSSAQTAAELERRIEEKNADIERLERDIKVFQGQLDTLGKQKDSLSVSIKELDLTKKKLTADISVTQSKIDKTNLNIQGLSKDINTKQSSISVGSDAIALELRKKNELEMTNFIYSVLSEDDFSMVWQDIDNMATVRERIREEVIELKEVKVELEDTREETVKAKNELTALRTKLADQKKIVDQNVAEKNKLLAQTKNSEANYQKLIAEQEARKIALEQEVDNYESELRFILNPAELPGRILGWPVDNVLITSPFGPRWGRMHLGTDFRAAIGTPIKSVADGRVIGTGNTDLTCPKASFGQWILIEHTSGLSSTYAHLSLIKVQKGDRVSRGEVIGYSGNSGSSTGPHLHLGIYAPQDSEGNPSVQVRTIPSKSCLGQTLTQPIAPTNAYLDPMKHLPSL